MDSLIRPPRHVDEAAWLALWDSYNRFYRASVPPEVTQSLWQTLLAGSGGIHGLIAIQDGRPVGLAHFLFHPSSWSNRPSCYLEDLFVTPAARGSVAGRALIEAVSAAAKARDADRLYWHTQEYNASARSLYDTLAERTSFIVYRIDLAAPG